MAITVPRDGQFRGISRAIFDRYRQALADLGVTLFEVPTDTFRKSEAGRIAALIEDLRAFRPECALGLPFGSYALRCRLPPDRHGRRLNLFTDVLDIPTICLWDHAPMDLGVKFLPEVPDPDASPMTAGDALRQLAAHPRLIHWSRDSGQTRIMQELGCLHPNRLIQGKPPVLPGFHEEDRVVRSESVAQSVAFVGHVYQAPTDYSSPLLEALAAGLIEAWLAGRCRDSLWDVLQQRIAALPQEEHRRAGLDPRRSSFWRFADNVICYRAQTALRLQMLGGARVPVACHGNLRTDAPGVPANLVPVPSQVPYGPELAELFSRYPITIDVLNPAFVEGYSHKQVHGFASGGFMLVNRKQDFVDAFGDAGEAVSYTGPEQVGAKVDRFLADPRYRREVGDAIRERIRTRFQLSDVLTRTLHAAFECMESMGMPGRRTPVPRRTVSVQDLLPGIRCKPRWEGASVEYDAGEAVVSTGCQRGAHAALVRIPETVADMREPHVRLRLVVEAGRIGVGTLDEATKALEAEQLVGPTARPVTVIVELVRAGARRLIVRNADSGISRVRVIEASLCDRAG